MNLNETKRLLAQIAAIDNRKLSEEAAIGWQKIIGHIPADIAEEALKLAQQDTSIRYLEPRHIVGWAKEAAFRLDRNKPREAEVRQGTAQPRCKEHNKAILECDPCCHQLYLYSTSNGFDGIERFGKAQIFA
jgi:hypothetical protein